MFSEICYMSVCIVHVRIMIMDVCSFFTYPGG
jgi:hypothetical protein